MKKIITILAISATTFAFSQNKPFTDNSTASSETAKAPIQPTDPVPIDTYIPTLAILAIGMVVYFGKKKQIFA